MPSRASAPVPPERTPPERTPPGRVLIVDDEPLIRDSLAELLEAEGLTVATAADGPSALALCERRPFDLALCDVQMPGMDGVTLLERLLKLHPEMFVVLVTAYGTVETAVAAFQRGAQDYLLKPLQLDEVVAKVRQLLLFRQLRLENQWLRRELHQASLPEAIVGNSPQMRQVYAVAEKVARTRSTVLIQGESGTGKELLARHIHRLSADREERFLAVNCAAIPQELLENQLFGHRRGSYTGADRDAEGLFVRVGAGTLFLDEIGEMQTATQAKLLRAIEQKEILPVGAQEPVRVQARIVAATNKDLAKAVAAGQFREDLYYRLNVITIHLPPLRERREDLPELIDHLLAKQAKALGKRIAGIEPAARQLLQTATWKGNIRELENALQRAVILAEGPLITPADLPPGLAPEAGAASTDLLRDAVAAFEYRHISRILRETPDKKAAAQRLGLALSSLYRKIEELGIGRAPRITLGAVWPATGADSGAAGH